MQAAAPMLPRIGPASPTRASASALLPSERDAITAPKNGINIGPLALIPSRRSAMNPAANAQPHNSAYAASETRIVPVEANSLSLGSRSRIALNFVSKARIAAPIADIRPRIADRRRGPRGAGVSATPSLGFSTGARGASHGAGSHFVFVSIGIDCRNGHLAPARVLSALFGAGEPGARGYNAYYIPGDDRLRRGRFVGVVASRGPGRPRKTPGKQ